MFTLLRYTIKREVITYSIVKKRQDKTHIEKQSIELNPAI